MGRQGEMPCVEQKDLGIAQIAPVSGGAGRREDLVALAPGDSHRRLVIAKTLMAGWVTLGVAAVIGLRIGASPPGPFRPTTPTAIVFGRSCGPSLARGQRWFGETSVGSGTIDPGHD